MSIVASILELVDVVVNHIKTPRTVARKEQMLIAHLEQKIQANNSHDDSISA